MIKFLFQKLNILTLLLLSLGFHLFSADVCRAQNIPLDIDSFRVLKDTTSPGFFVDIQTISSRADYIRKSLSLIDPDYLNHLRPDTTTFHQLIKNKKITGVLRDIENNKLDDAATSLKAVNNFSGKFPYLQYLDGWIHFKKENYREAVKRFSLLQRAFGGYGHSIEVSLLNAISYSKLDDFENSVKFFNKALRSYSNEIQAIKEERNRLDRKKSDSALLADPEKLFKGERIPDLLKRLLQNQQVVTAYETIWFLDQAKERLLYNKTAISKEFVSGNGKKSRNLSQAEKKIGEQTESAETLRSIQDHLDFLKELNGSADGTKGNKKNIVGRRIDTILAEIASLRAQIFRSLKIEFTTRYDGVIATKDTLPAWINFYLSRAFYKDYLKNGRPFELLKPAIDVHKAYIRDFKKTNFSLTQEVVNRLIDLRYDLEGFTKEIVALYQILLTGRFAQESDTIEALFELGTAYYNEGMYWKASEIFEDLQKQHKKNKYTPAVLFLRGEILLKKGEMEEALPYFSMASSHINTYFALPALYRRGWIAEKMEDSERTVDLLSKALLYIEEFRRGLIGIAIPEENLAIKALSDKIYDEAINTITNNLYENGKTEKLFKYFNDYRDAGFLPHILVSFSQVYREQRDYAGQIALYKRFLFSFPEKHMMQEIFDQLLTEYNARGLTRHSEKVRNILISFYDDERFSDLDRSMFRGLVAECYVKSAAYHHAIARDNKDLAEYEKAAKIYREYLDRFNDRKNIVEVNLRLARLLSETGDDAGAGIEFTKAAWEYPHKGTKKLQKKAALASVDSLYRHIQKNREPSQKILDLFYLSADLFISVFPDSIDSTKVLYFVGDKQFMEKDYKQAAETFSNIIEMSPDRGILLKSMQRLALAHYYRGNYLEAKTHFHQLMTYMLTSSLPNSTERGNILYKVGDTYYSLNSYDRFNKSLKSWKDGIWVSDLTEKLWEQINTLGTADDIYRNYEIKFARLIGPFSEEDKKLLLYSQEMVVLSTLNLSDLYVQEKKYDDAIKLLFDAAILTKERETVTHYLYRAANLFKKKEDLKTAYSIFSFIEKSEAITKDKKYNYPVLMQLAYISGKLKKQQDLVDNLLKVAGLNELDGNKKMDAVAKAGFAYQAIGNHSEALKMFERFVAATSDKNERFQEISFKAGETAEKLGQLKKARRYYRGALAGGEGPADPEKGSYYAAAAGFKINELDFRKFKSMTKDTDIKKYLVLKQKRMNKLIKAYSRIIRYGVLEFTTASNYRIGSLYEDFAADFSDSPIPLGLTSLQEEKYKQLLSKKVMPLKDKAAQTYSRNLKLLREKKFNRWIEMSLISYSDLDSLFTIKNEQLVDMNHIVAPLSAKRSHAAPNGIAIPGFETALPTNSVTSSVH